jgi:hypothetical protein
MAFTGTGERCLPTPPSERNAAPFLDVNSKKREELWLIASDGPLHLQLSVQRCTSLGAARNWHWVGGNASLFLANFTLSLICLPRALAAPTLHLIVGAFHSSR